jgi:acyl-coenzyme A synthetase/AMP-(fatty) acid ligase
MKIKDLFFKNNNDEVVLSTFSSNYSSNDFKLSMENFMNILQHEDLTGKRIGLLIPSVFSYMSLVLAINELGGTIVPLSAQFRKEDLTAVLDSLDPHYVFTVDEVGGYSFADIFSSWSEKSGKITKIFTTKDYTNWEQKVYAGIIRPLQEDKMDFICFSSGSTGVPKGIVISVESLQVTSNLISNVNKLQPRDRLFFNIPPNTIFGISTLLSGVTNRLQMVFPDRFDLPEIVQLIADKKCNKILSTPSIFKTIYQVATVLNAQVLKNLEQVVLAGEMITEGIVEQFESMDNCEFVGFYGSSELGAVMRCDLPGKIEFTIIEGNEYKIKDSELLIKSPATFSHYYQNPALTKEVFDLEGWFLTGDLVQETDESKISIIGRKKDMIKKAGQQVIPGEIEKVLMDHDQVIQAVVFGTPHPVFGEQVVAYVVTEGNDNMQELYEFCQKKIAKYKVPDIIEKVLEIPLIQGKVDKLTLRKMFNQRKVGAKSK